MSYTLTIECDDLALLTNLVATLHAGSDPVTNSKAGNTPAKQKPKAEMKVISETVGEPIEEEFDGEQPDDEVTFTRADVGQAFKTLLNTVDRAAVSEVKKKFGVKQIGDLTKDQYIDVMFDIEERLNLNKDEVSDKIDEDLVEGLFPDEEGVDVPELAMVKLAAKAMAKESRREYEKTLKKYGCADTRSLAKLDDAKMVAIFADMNDFLGAAD